MAASVPQPGKRRRRPAVRPRKRRLRRLFASSEGRHPTVSLQEPVTQRNDRITFSTRRAAGAQILHERVRYEERGPAVSEEAKNVRARTMIRGLRTLGYHVERLPAPSSSPV